jgi:hypothetical protein
MDHLEKR